MEEDRENLEFQVDHTNLQLALRNFRDRGMIDDMMYWDFINRLWSAKTMEELRQLAKKLAELVKAEEGENV